MAQTILSKVNDAIKKYQEQNKGELPLYIILYTDDGRQLLEEVNQLEENQGEVIITSYKGIKIQPHELAKPGEIRLSNDLPEVGS